MLFKSDRLIVKPCRGVGRSMTSTCDCNTSKVLRGGAVQMHITSRNHGYPTCRSELTKRRCPRKLSTLSGRCIGDILDARTKATSTSFIEGAIADNNIGHACGYGHCSQCHSSTCRTSAVVHATEVSQTSDTNMTRNFNFGVIVRRVRHHSVNVTGRQTCIGNRCSNCL